MAMQATRKETPVSMRFRDDDLAVIDRGAALLGLSRTEFVRRAALHDAQLAMLNQTVVRVSSDTYADFDSRPSTVRCSRCQRKRSSASVETHLRPKSSCRSRPSSHFPNSHDLEGFESGKSALDDWLKTFARANQRQDFTRVMVIHEDGKVIGYYGLAPSAIDPSAAPRRVRTGRPPDPIPCLLIGQLAVDRRRQKPRDRFDACRRCLPALRSGRGDYWRPRHRRPRDRCRS